MVFNTSNKIVPYSGNTEKKSPNTEKMNKIILDNHVLKEKQLNIEPVSYTHLTLPTNREV